MKPAKITICFLVAFFVTSTNATVRLVPQEHATIKQAVDACAASGDTIIIAPGRYADPENRNIYFRGKQITVRSANPTDLEIIKSTIIDCQGQGRAFIFCSAENRDSIVTGLTLTNGYAFLGGAVYCYNNSSPTITNCIITSNSASLGAAIACTNTATQLKIANCLINSNTASVAGGAIYCSGASPSIRNCIISENSAVFGAAIYFHNPGTLNLENCTISANLATQSAAGIYCYQAANINLINSILWANEAPYAQDILLGHSTTTPASANISYSDFLQGNNNISSEGNATISFGPGNIYSDPCFVTADDSNTAGIDYNLHKSSACVDAGDPAFATEPNETDIDGTPRIAGIRIDIGADEYLPPIPATIEITPKVINAQSKGNWIACTVTLPEQYSIENIDLSTITLNEKLSPASYTIKNSEQKLCLKFKRLDVQKILNIAQGPVLITITGKLNNGKPFEGTDTIRLVKKNTKK